MKAITYLVFTLFLIAACSKISTTENIKTVEKYVAAVEARDYSTMEALLAEDYMGYGPSHSDSIDKKSALASWKANIENLYESISYERSQIIAVNVPTGPNKGEWVANWAELRIVYQDGSGPVTIWVNSNYKIENGKIIKSYTFYNEADALRQLGYTIYE